MEPINHLVTPAKFREKLKNKLGNLWSGLDKKNFLENRGDSDEQWKSLSGNIRQLLIRAASEPDFPIDFNFGETPFSYYANQMTNIDPKGKLKKLIVRSGTGEEVPSNAVVYIHYRAYLENEEFPFTTSYMHSHLPRRYQLGSGSLCGGFEAAMSTMKIGEKSHFLLSPEIAFGKGGCPPLVPGSAEVLLEVELCDLVRHEYRTIKGPNFQRKDHESENILQSVQEIHHLANEFYRNGNFVCAAINYRKAENLLTFIKYLDEDGEKFRKEKLLKMIVNQVVTFVTGNKNLVKPQEAVSAALRAFQHVPAEAAMSIKLKYNLAKAYILLNEKEKAFQLLKEARKFEPNNNLIRNLYFKLEKQITEKIENESTCWKRALKKFPEHNTREQYITFLRASMKTDLENYLENPTSNIGMPWNYTSDERFILGRQAEKMNLIYEEFRSQPSNVTVSIHKKGSAMLLSERDEILTEVISIDISDEEEEDDDEEDFIGWDINVNELSDDAEGNSSASSFALSPDEDSSSVIIISDSDSQVDDSSYILDEPGCSSELRSKSP